MEINIVYHWSPSVNRESILQDGLKICMDEISYYNPVTKKQEFYKPPYICTSTDPMLAYAYVEPTFCEEVPPLDLFQIYLKDTDSITLRNDNTNKIIEVRINNSVSPDYIRYVGSR